MPPNHDLANQVLSDLGELRLIDEVIAPLAQRYEKSSLLGDDCAVLEVGPLKLAISADVGPRPAIQSLGGHENDFEAAGWHAAVATASDIATTGARPLFMTNCIDAPPELPVAVLSQFVDGLFRAYAEFGFRNAGGDIRHGPNLASRITGVGIIEHGCTIGRGGVEPGDVLVLIGQAGKFMAAYLTALCSGSHSLSSDQLDWLRFPRPMLREMQALCSEGFIKAASDSSDGVLGAIDNLARRSNCGFELNLDPTLLGPDVKHAAELYACSPWNIFFCWGDWSVAAVVPQARMEALKTVAANHHLPYRVLGKARRGPPLLWALDDTRVLPMTVIRNENFLARGFNAGIKGHLEYMLRTPLTS